MAWNFAWWHEAQSIAVPVNFPFAWHWAQATLWWAPVRGKRVRL